MSKRLILCSCLESQKLDPAAFETLEGVACSRVHGALCSRESEQAARHLAAGDALIACAQERAFFEDLAAETGVPAPAFVDLRDRAGWSDEGAQAGPKMAALVAEALLEAPMVKMLDLESEGRCLLIGAPEVALPAAARLADALAVTVLLEAPADFPPDRRFDVICGRLKSARGALGGFELRIDGLCLQEPGGRGTPGFSEPRDGGRSSCDIILDLSGGAPLFPAPHKRDGYLRADPRDPRAVADAVFEAAQLVGSFEKPLHVAIRSELCAHSRAGITGCTRCLDICPTGAIAPAGDAVSVDPAICAGCGGCSALCPSGAVSLEAPEVAFTMRRLETLARVFREAGGRAPRLLVHDEQHGAEMISLAARYGRGLPADVIPLSMPALAGFGHAEMLAALGCGFVRVEILLSPATERAVVERECALAVAIAGADVIGLLEPADPDALSAWLFGEEGAAARPCLGEITPILPMGSRRQVSRLAAAALRGSPEAPIALPEGAPYGSVSVDPDACTLCLSCASLCPTGALGDNPDKPQLRFQEDACLQCGLCARLCPEDAITLQPRLDLSDAALAQRVLHEEEPFACIECGALFGVRSAIEKISEKLAGKHEMFADSDAARLIRMCDDCRVRAQYHDRNSPMRAAERPRVVTTEDYFSKRRDH